MNTVIKIQIKINKLQTQLKNHGNYTRAALAKMVIELLDLEAQLERLQRTVETTELEVKTIPSRPYLETMQKIKKIITTEDLKSLFNSGKSGKIKTDIKEQVLKSLNYLINNYSKKMAAFLNKIYKQMNTLGQGQKTIFFLNQVELLMA